LRSKINSKEGASQIALSIKLFGSLEAALDGNPLPGLHLREGRRLLSFLVMQHEEDVPYQAIARIFWPAEAHFTTGQLSQYHNTRQAIYSLRLALGSEAPRLVRTGRGVLRLELFGAEIDVIAFDQRVGSNDVGAWLEAFTLYRGPLLADWSDAWLIEPRARRKRSYDRLLRRLIAHTQSEGDSQQRLTYLRAAIHSSPEEEALWRDLLSILAQQGDYETTEEEYQRLCELLRSLGRRPEAETEALLADLRRAALTAPILRSTSESVSLPAVDTAAPAAIEKRSPAFARRDERPGNTQRLRPDSEEAAPVEPPGPALSAALPPLPALETPRNNLPATPTSFIGRNREITQISDLLAEHSLVTLTGTGGCGKTRLALQVAAATSAPYPDGTWLVEFASLSDPELLPQTISRALGLAEQAGKTSAQTLIDALKTKRLMLVLDNCEHLLVACATLVSALLRSCPEARVLATSREPLGIAGEQTYGVPSLSLPAPKQTLSWEALGQYEAVRLFTERARGAKSEFALSDQNAEAVRQICARLDGIPLAIELAAARVRSLSASEIGARLDNRFRLLTRGDRAAPPRQQTLRALIDWSYDLLTPEERSLLARLGVFAGGWTLDAAEAVCAEGIGVLGYWGVGVVPSPHCAANREEKAATASAQYPIPQHPIPNTQHPSDVLDLLASLVDKSLVVAEEQKGVTRYRLLETVREYAVEKLQESGETERIKARHRDWFLALAEVAEPQLRGSEQQEWLDRLEREHDNLRTALAWCAEEEAGVEAGLRLAGALGPFWNTRGHLTEGRNHLQRALERRGVQPYKQMRAQALRWAGSMARYQGDYERARALIEESLDLCNEMQDSSGIAQATGILGALAVQQSDYDRARRLLEECLDFYRKLESRGGITFALMNLGNVLRRQGDYEQARHLYEETLRLSKESGDKYYLSQTLHNLAVLAAEQGDHEQARRQYEEAETLFRELGDRYCLAQTQYNLGNLAYTRGDYNQSHRQYEECLNLFRETGHRLGIAMALQGLGRVAHVQGNPQHALRLLQEGLRVSREQNYTQEVAGGLQDVASVRLSLRDPAGAVLLWGACEAMRERLDMTLPADEQAEYDRQVKQVRSTLGEEAFAVAWKEGRSLNEERATDLALEAGPAPLNCPGP
jgi:predicted ATPase/DNA-binding SARP family transcriptional activator/TolA-binding protein